MKRRYYAALTAYCLGIFWLSHQSSPDIPDALRFPGEDKVAHMVLYGGLAALLSIALHSARRVYPTWIMRYGPVLFAFFYGITDELHQYFVPLRTPSLLDLVADLAGAALAQVACLRFFRWRAERRDAAPNET